MTSFPSALSSSSPVSYFSFLLCFLYSIVDGRRSERLLCLPQQGGLAGVKRSTDLLVQSSPSLLFVGHMEIFSVCCAPELVDDVLISIRLPRLAFKPQRLLPFST